METSKQESVSRQSSILKPPKQRQPLQCVAANPSSSENSPTIKLKRRVSFAKNRRIREFCNEAEQGTVWDDTYEEHDLSNTKSSCSDQPIVISVPCDDKENFPVQLFLPNNELDCKEVPPSLSNEEDILLQCDMEMDNSINNLESPCTQMQNPEIEYPNTTIFCDDMDITVPLPTNIIPCHNQREDHLDDTVPVSQIQNISMELTENVPATLYKKPSNSQKNKNEFFTIGTTNSTELTQAMSKLLGIGDSKKLINKVEPKNVNHNLQITEDKTDFLDNEPMEFTSVLPSSTWIRPNSKCQNNENTENLTKTMEFTTAVSHMNIINNQQNVYNTSEKTTIFPNKSMEITEAINIHNIIQNQISKNKILHEGMQEKTKIFSNKSMEMTETIPVYDINYEICSSTEKISDKKIEEKTQVFHNISMEMTEAVTTQRKIQPGADMEQILEEKTKIFSNKSMEMTGVLPVHNKNCQSGTDTQVTSTQTEAVPVINKNIESNKQLSNVSSVQIQDKTEIFLNKSMEMTEALHYGNINNEVYKVKEIPCNEMQEKTKIYNNVSMEITEAVNNKSQFLKNSKQGLLEILPEKTTIFQDKSMEMTEAISSCNQVFQSNTNIKSTANNLQGKTKIFLNHSMDMTEAVSVLPLHYKEKTLQGKIGQDKTEIFGNKSMEMTEAISTYSKISNEKIQEETKIFPNLSMEITDAISTHRNVQKSNANDINKSFDKEKTNIINKSMEMTEAVPVYNTVYQSDTTTNKIRNKLTQRQSVTLYNKPNEISDQLSAEIENIPPAQEKTKVFLNKSMDISETIPINHKITECYRTLYNKNQTGNAQNKTDIVNNKSMDLTEAISSYQIVAKFDQHMPKGNSNEEKTEYFVDKSMDRIEVIPAQKNILPNIENKQLQCNNTIERTRIFHNKSVNISETIPIQQNFVNNQILQKIQPEIINDQTKFFQDKSMDFTEIIPVHQQFSNFNRNDVQNKIQGNNPEKNTDRLVGIMDKSKENFHCNTKLTKESTRVVQDLHDMSMDLTSKLCTLPIITKCQPKSNIQKTNTAVYYDTSMELTSGLPISQTVVRDLSNQQKDKIISTDKNLGDDQELYDSTKLFRDTSMEFTAIPSFPSNAKSNRDEYTENIFQKDIENIPSSINASNNCTKANNYEITGKYKSREDNYKSREDNYKSREANYKAREDNYKSREDNYKSRENNYKSREDNYKSREDYQSREDNYKSKENNYKSREDNYKSKEDNYKSKEDNYKSREDNQSRDDYKSREDNYNSREDYKSREDNFHRMTSDELNSLCASMNLPTQKYDKDYSMNSQSDYISVCNDVNVLRDSLEKNNMFQQNGTILTTKSTFSDKDKSSQMCTSGNEHLNKENSYGYSDMGTSKQKFTQKEALKDDAISMKVSQIPTNSRNKLITQNNINISTTEMLCETIPIHMEIDKTAEVSIKYSEPKQLCSTVKSLHDDLLNIDKHPIQNQENLYFNYAKTINENQDRNMEIDIINTINNDKSHLSNQFVEKSCTEANLSTYLEKGEQLPKDKIEIYHDLSMEFTAALPTEVTTKQKLDESKSKKTISISNAAKVACYTTDKNKDDNIVDENSLTRLPSDNTELLLATMGFKAELSHPLVINDKTTIKISSKSFTDKTYTVNTNMKVQNQIESNQIYTVNATTNVESNVESNNLMNNEIDSECGSLIHTDIPIVASDLIKGNVEEECDSSDKENKEPGVRINLFPERCTGEEELEEIEPPSFLCFDSIQDFSLQNNEIINIDQCNEIHNSNKCNEIPNTHGLSINNEDLEKKNTIVNENIIKVVQTEKRQQSSGEELKTFNYDLYALLKKTKEKNEKLLSSKKDNKKQSKEDMIHENISDNKMNKKLLFSKKDNKIQNKENRISESVNDKNDELLSAFTILTRDIKLHEKSNDCIWNIRTLSTNIIVVDFIAKSFVIIIKLNAIEKACIRDIEKVEICSRLRTDSSNLLLRIVHNLLLLKLNTNEMLAKYKMYEDILPMLEYISNEVIFTMNFMFDLKSLQALNLLNIDEKRIIFMVSSRKANIILKVSLVIKMFNEIGPDDIDVTCILGDIRKKDIKQMIINIRKDYRFLSRYISDIKEYITLMEESINSNKH